MRSKASLSCLFMQNKCIAEPQISHFVYFKPCEIWVQYVTFGKCEINVRSISMNIRVLKFYRDHDSGVVVGVRGVTLLVSARQLLKGRTNFI